jgi:hypothetical protein
MEVLTPSTYFRTPRMNIHKNASMTPKGRAHLVREIDRIGLKAAAAAAGLSTRTARKWQPRVALHGAAGLADRSSRPHSSPARGCPHKIERAVGLQGHQRLTYDRIAERVACPGVRWHVPARVAAWPSCHRCKALWRSGATSARAQASCCTWTPRSCIASTSRGIG